VNLQALNIFLPFYYIHVVPKFLISFYIPVDRLYGLVVRVPGYRSRCPGLDSRRCQIFCEIIGLEWGPLSLVRIIEELLERKVAAPV
jgi:hypothetical protein